MKNDLFSPQYLYDTRDERNRVLRLQRFLRTLSRSADQPMWNTAENGIYDSATRAAVRHFQRSYALPITGEVDLPTWELMRELYEFEMAKNAAPRAITPFPDPHRRIEEGEYSDLVLQLQIMLHALRLYYDALPPFPLSGRYDSMTAEAIRAFRRIHHLEGESGVDATVWNRIAEEYNRISRENQ